MEESNKIWNKPADAWKVEAADIHINNLTDSDFNDYFVIKDEVKEFLHSPTKKIIKAPKGYGKTLFLRKKALEYKTNLHINETFPASNELCEDGRDISVPFTEDNMFRKNYFISKLNQKSIVGNKIYNIMLAWEYAIVSAAYDYVEMKDRQSSNITLRKFCNALTMSPDEIKKLLTQDIFRNFNKECYIFIDNIDKMVSFGYDVPLTKNFFHREKDVDINIFYFWSAIQLGFCLAIAELPKKHIHVYGAIRHEALSLLDEDYFFYADRSKLTRLISSLDYSKHDIEKIFYDNIALSLDAKTFSKHSYPAAIKYYFGLTSSNIKNNVVGNKNEGLFDYLSRHTLLKPRDIIEIGSRIQHVKANIPETKKREVHIRERIHSADIYKNIVKDYLTEIGSSLVESLNLLFEYPDKIPNILTYKKMREICNWINYKKTNQNCLDCSECKGNHFFCHLYNAGLLGVEYRSPVRILQKFQLPHERNDVITGGIKSLHKLDTKNFFFIHPLLYDQGDFEINTKVFIGEGVTFYAPVTYKRLEYNGKKFSLLGELVDEFAFRVHIRNKQNSLHSIDKKYKTIDNFITDTDVIDMIGLTNIEKFSTKLEKIDLNYFTKAKRITS